MRCTLSLQGRAARRQDDQIAARRASHAAASTSGASHSSRAAPAPAHRQAPKQVQAAGAPARAGPPSSHSKGRLPGFQAPVASSGAHSAQAAKQRQHFLSPEEEARVARTLSNPAFGGTATSNSAPKTGLMDRYGQQTLLSHRIEAERRVATGVPQHVSFVDDIMPKDPNDAMPDYPGDFRRAAAKREQELASLAARELRQLQAVGASQSSARQLAASPAGAGVAWQAINAVSSYQRLQGGFGGGTLSSQSSRTQEEPLCQAEGSGASSSILGSAEVSTQPVLHPAFCLPCALQPM